jgi:hypothetical protein
MTTTMQEMIYCKACDRKDRRQGRHSAPFAEWAQTRDGIQYGVGNSGPKTFSLINSSKLRPVRFVSPDQKSSSSALMARIWRSIDCSK